MWGGSPLPFLLSSWTHVHIYFESDKPDINHSVLDLYLDNTSKLETFPPLGEIIRVASTCYFPN